MATPRLAIDGISVAFGKARVLSQVDISVGEGEVVGLVGPNGAGKTTTLRAVSGTVPLSGGQILVHGKPVRPAPSRMPRLGVAHVPEGRGLIPTMTVEQNLKLGLMAIGRRATAADIAAVLQVFPRLEHLLGTQAVYLSGGEQQMVALARGLIVRPQVLMVDELSLGLAPKIVSVILSALTQEARDRGTALLIVDQNVRSLANVCDSICVLSNGRSSLAQGSDLESLSKSIYLGND